MQVSPTLLELPNLVEVKCLRVNKPRYNYDSLPLSGIYNDIHNEEDPNAYFEFKLHTLELTGSTALEVTDFAEADDKSDSIDLWDSQVDDLKRSLGII